MLSRDVFYRTIVILNTYKIGFEKTWDHYSSPVLISMIFETAYGESKNNSLTKFSYDSFYIGFGYLIPNGGIIRFGRSFNYPVIQKNPFTGIKKIALINNIFVLKFLTGERKIQDLVYLIDGTANLTIDQRRTIKYLNVLSKDILLKLDSIQVIQPTAFQTNIYSLLNKNKPSPFYMIPESFKFIDINNKKWIQDFCESEKVDACLSIYHFFQPVQYGKGSIVTELILSDKNGEVVFSQHFLNVPQDSKTQEEMGFFETPDDNTSFKLLNDLIKIVASKPQPQNRITQIIERDNRILNDVLIRHYREAFNNIPHQIHEAINKIPYYYILKIDEK